MLLAIAIAVVLYGIWVLIRVPDPAPTSRHATDPKIRESARQYMKDHGIDNDCSCDDCDDDFNDFVRDFDPDNDDDDD